MKNMDPLNDNVATLLHQSTEKFVAELWKDGKLFSSRVPSRFLDTWNINRIVFMVLPSHSVKKETWFQSLVSRIVCLVKRACHASQWLDANILTWWGELLIQLQRVKLWAGRCVWIKMHPARHFAILLIPQQIHMHCNCNQGCFTLITDQNSEEIWNNAKIQSGMRHILYVLFQHWLYFQLK